MAKNRKHTSAFKLKVVQEYISGVSGPELARKYNIHGNLVYKWRDQFEANPSTAFRSDTDGISEQDARIAELEKENAELAALLGKSMLEQDFLKKSLMSAERAVRHLPLRDGRHETDGTT